MIREKDKRNKKHERKSKKEALKEGRETERKRERISKFMNICARQRTYRVQRSSGKRIYISENICGHPRKGQRFFDTMAWEAKTWMIAEHADEWMENGYREHDNQVNRHALSLNWRYCGMRTSTKLIWQMVSCWTKSIHNGGKQRASGAERQ